MRHTITFPEWAMQELLDVIFSQPDVEGGAYLLCGRSADEHELRLLVREVLPIHDSHYLRRDRQGLSIASPSYAAVAKRARATNASVVFVHSHPAGFSAFSPQDDLEEPKLMQFLTGRVPDVLHGSLVVVSDRQMTGRTWDGLGWKPICRIRTIGTRFRFIDDVQDVEPIPEFFDRQVRAFGKDIQLLLARLHVGVVGAGGTGAAVIEQLIRLGVGTISIFDGDDFERSNLHRLIGSVLADVGRCKVSISSRNAKLIGLGTKINVHPRHITEEQTARAMRACDLVFGCTDKHAPRGILVRLTTWYHIPVIDLGLKIDAPGGVIRGVYGRVTVQAPGEACLFCRKRISSEMIRLESLSPAERKALADENYAPEIEDAEPAVLSFTMAVAAQGVTEMIHRLTGFMGDERLSSETLMFHHDASIRTNRPAPQSGCACHQTQYIGRGDRRDFLDLMWAH